MRKVLTVLICLTLWSCASNDKLSKTEQKAKAYYEHGTRELYHGNFIGALESLMKADSFTPNDPNILTNLAMAYFYSERKETAIANLRKAIEINPQHPDALINLASIYMGEKEYEKAESLLLKVADNVIYRKQFITYTNLGKIYLSRNNFQKAHMYTDKAIKVYSQYCPALFQKGLIEYTQSNFDEASKSFREGIKGVCYNNTEAHYYRALTFKKLKNYQEAEEIFEKIKIDFAKSPLSVKAELELSELRKIKKRNNYSQKREIITPRF